MTKVNLSVRDYSDEKSSFGLYIPDVDETNWVATNAALATLNTALAAMTIGNITRFNLDHETGLAGADQRPSSPYAQRELGARFFYVDDVTSEKYNFTVPCPDLLVIGNPGTDDLDLTLSVVAALVTAVEAVAVSPDGNAITIERGKIVGRRS